MTNVKHAAEQLDSMTDRSVVKEANSMHAVGQVELSILNIMHH
jgi:hypothetical protein